jgi:hypothetical protein
MTDLPTKVQIGPYEIEIRCSQIAIDHAHAQSDAYVDGATMIRKGWIAIRPEISDSAKREVLLHEVMHAAWFVAGRRDEKVSDETAISILAPTLLDTLRRNPELAAYLLNS